MRQVCYSLRVSVHLKSLVKLVRKKNKMRGNIYNGQEGKAPGSGYQQGENYYICHGMQHSLEKNTYWKLIVL